MAELSETVAARIDSLDSGAPARNVSIGTASATGTITGDDPRPTIGIADAAVLEGNAGTATLTFTVTRTGDAEADQTFSYTFADVTTDRVIDSRGPGDPKAFECDECVPDYEAQRALHAAGSLWIHAVRAS